MKKILIGLFIIQIAVLGFMASSKLSGANDQAKVEINLTITLPEIEEDVVTVRLPTLPGEKVDPFDFNIPLRRRVTQEGKVRLISLDKNLNIMETMGDAMMENPIFMRGIEKAIRRQFAEFYADFVKEANLTPDEQIELFKIMSLTMKDNIKSLMSSMGKNMNKMEEMFKDGPPAEMIEGIKSNNMAMKEGFIATLGEERFELFEQYHKEKSAAESFMRMKNQLDRRKVPLSEEQEGQMRQSLLDQQQSPFNEETYSGENSDTSTGKGILDEKQQGIYDGSRKRHNRILMLPF